MTGAQQYSADTLVNSLDFDFDWSVRDHAAAHRPHTRKLREARAAVPSLVKRFTRVGVYAMWVTIWFLSTDGVFFLVRL
jgi:hypothetical protein